MKKLTDAYKLFKKNSFNKGIDLKLIFVSCDPDWDSPEKIKKFLSYFDNQDLLLTFLLEEKHFGTPGDLRLRSYLAS